MRLTADHGEIRRWIEDHGGSPALVQGDGTPGRLTVAFENSEAEALSWDEFFELFEGQGLAFAYSPDANGEGVRTAKLVSR